MKQFLYFIFLILCFTSCYVYQPLEPTLDEEGKEIPVPPIRAQFEQNKLYKILVSRGSLKAKQYKVQFDEWDNDTLVVKLNANEKKVRKFNINDIQAVKHRRFQGFFTNGLTIASYGLIALGIILLL